MKPIMLIKVLIYTLITATCQRHLTTATDSKQIKDFPMSNEVRHNNPQSYNRKVFQDKRVEGKNEEKTNRRFRNGEFKQTPANDRSNSPLPPGQFGFYSNAGIGGGLIGGIDGGFGGGFRGFGGGFGGPAVFSTPGQFPIIPNAPGYPPYDGIFGTPNGPGKFPGPSLNPFGPGQGTPMGGPPPSAPGGPPLLPGAPNVTAAGPGAVPMAPPPASTAEARSPPAFPLMSAFPYSYGQPPLNPSFPPLGAYSPGSQIAVRPPPASEKSKTKTKSKPGAGSPGSDGSATPFMPGFSYGYGQPPLNAMAPPTGAYSPGSPVGFPEPTTSKPKPKARPKSKTTTTPAPVTTTDCGCKKEHGHYTAYHAPPPQSYPMYPYRPRVPPNPPRGKRPRTRTTPVPRPRYKTTTAPDIPSTTESYEHSSSPIPVPYSPAQTSQYNDPSNQMYAQAPQQYSPPMSPIIMNYYPVRERRRSLSPIQSKADHQESQIHDMDAKQPPWVPIFEQPQPSLSSKQENKHVMPEREHTAEYHSPVHESQEVSNPTNEESPSYDETDDTEEPITYYQETPTEQYESRVHEPQNIEKVSSHQSMRSPSSVNSPHLHHQSAHSHQHQSSETPNAYHSPPSKYASSQHLHPHFHTTTKKPCKLKLRTQTPKLFPWEYNYARRTDSFSFGTKKPCPYKLKAQQLAQQQQQQSYISPQHIIATPSTTPPPATTTVSPPYIPFPTNNIDHSKIINQSITPDMLNAQSTHHEVLFKPSAQDVIHTPTSVTVPLPFPFVMDNNGLLQHQNPGTPANSQVTYKLEMNSDLMSKLTTPIVINQPEQNPFNQIHQPNQHFNNAIPPSFPSFQNPMSHHQPQIFTPDNSHKFQVTPSESSAMFPSASEQHPVQQPSVIVINADNSDDYDSPDLPLSFLRSSLSSSNDSPYSELSFLSDYGYAFADQISPRSRRRNRLKSAKSRKSQKISYARRKKGRRTPASTNKKSYVIIDRAELEELQRSSWDLTQDDDDENELFSEKNRPPPAEVVHLKYYEDYEDDDDDNELYDKSPATSFSSSRKYRKRNYAKKKTKKIASTKAKATYTNEIDEDEDNK